MESISSLSLATTSYNKVELMGTLNGKLAVLEALRNEAAQKCSQMTKPDITLRVNIQKLSMKQVAANKEALKVFTTSKNRQGTPFSTTPTRKDLETGHVKIERTTSDSQSELELMDQDNDYCLGDDNHDNNDYNYSLSRENDIPAEMDEDELTKIHISTTPATLTTSKINVAQARSIYNPESRKYKCTLCPKEFVAAYVLNAHYKSVHLKVKYKCKLCGMAFSYNQSYRRHHRNIHGT